MKRMMFTLGLSIVCLIASAQPTSLGGIKPGQTTREDLKNLVKDPDQVDTNKDEVKLTLIQPEVYVTVHFYDDIVYKLSTPVSDLSDDLMQALIEKYKRPHIKVGNIGTEVCRNGFGATVKMPVGETSLKWPVKDGVQGAYYYFALGCYDAEITEYQLLHVATAKVVDRANLKKEQKAKEDKKRALGNY